MLKKIDKLRLAYNGGDYKAALKIAHDFFFGFSKQEKAIIDRGYECFIRPNSYAALGYNPEDCKQKALMLLSEIYNLEKI